MFKRVKRVRLRNNQAVILRQANPNDLDRLMTMHHWVSSESLYQRYLRHTEVSESEMRMICHLKPSQGVAFVAGMEGAQEIVIGYGYYVIDSNAEPVTAEFALLVQDDYQGLGLGSLLLEMLVTHALQHGVAAFDMVVAANNHAIMQLIRSIGLWFSIESGYGMHDVVINLETEAQPSFSVMNETEREVEHILRLFGWSILAWTLPLFAIHEPCIVRFPSQKR
jgi:acetyltransferase